MTTVHQAGEIIGLVGFILTTAGSVYLDVRIQILRECGVLPKDTPGVFSMPRNGYRRPAISFTRIFGSSFTTLDRHSRWTAYLIRIGTVAIAVGLLMMLAA